MNINLPPVAEIKAFLEQLGHAQVQQLATDSSVPFTTLWKIRDGTTTNPGIETVRKFWPKLAQAQTNSAQAAPETVAISGELPVSRVELVEAIKEGLFKDPRQTIRREADRNRRNTNDEKNALVD